MKNTFNGKSGFRSAALRIAVAAILPAASLTFIASANGADAPVATTLVRPEGLPNISALPFTGKKSATFTAPTTMVNY